MQVFNVAFQALALLLGLGLVGFIIIRRKILPEHVLSVLTPLVVDIALPCLVFANILSRFDPAANPGWWQLPLWWALFTASLALASVLFGYTAKSETRREFRMSLFFQNGIFIPTGLIMGFFGRDSAHLANLFLFMIFYPALFFNTYHLFYRKEGSAGGIRWGGMFNPVLLATLLAVVLVLAGAAGSVPPFVAALARELGGITIPLIMIILGGSIYLDFKRRGPLFWGEIVKFVAIKNILFPLAALGILYLTRPAFSLALLVIIQSAMPPITAVPAMIERVRGDAAAVNQFLLFSFIASIVTVPAVLLLFHRIYPLL